MDKKKLAYFAGFFDGEGSVSIAKLPNNTCTGKPQHYLYIQICNEVKAPLDEIKKYLNGSVYSYKAESGKTMWRWCGAANVAEKFLREIQPYSIVKKNEIKLALEFNKKNQNHPGKLLSENVIRTRDLYKLKLEQMHKNRGALNEKN